MNHHVTDPILRTHEHLIKHPSGRRVLVSVFGARDFARCVFYSHGFPASRYEAVIAHGVAREKGITIVALDRPGFGGSDWYPGRAAPDWAEDVRLVAAHFGVREFSLLGVSGGTPAAVAAAALLGDQVQSLTIVSGVGPVRVPGVLQGMNWANATLIKTALRFEWLGTGAIGALAALWRSAPIAANLWFATLLPKADRAIMRRPEVGRIFARNIQESLRQGVRGTVSDFEILISDWSPFLSQIKVPTTIWHGEADTYVPISMAHFLHQNISGSTFHKVVDGGHFMIVDRLAPILEGLA